MAGVRQFDRERVLDGLAAAFWTHGFEGVSIEQLERATGLRRGSLYNAFGGKEAMFLAALDRYALRVAEPMRTALDDPDPRSGVARLLEAQVTLMTGAGAPGGCLAAGSCHELGGREGRLGRKIAEDTRAHETMILTALTRWRAAGRVVEGGDLRPLARFLVALMRGLAALHRATGDVEAVRDAARTALTVLEPWVT